LRAATEGIKRVFPNASITSKCLDDYPMKVKISVGQEELWQSDQRNLYRKYPQARADSLNAIEAALRKKFNL
jgi:hypothetical protein